MAITRSKKEEILVKLEDRFNRAEAVVFTGYKGSSVKEMEEARNVLREAGIDYHIAKKTLIKLAVKKIKNIEIDDEVMVGPVGVAFGFEDAVSLCKVLAKIAKDNESFEMLGGLVDGEGVDKKMVEQLSKMLSRDELLAKFVGLLRAPLYGFSGILNSGLGSFARALKEYGEKKGE